MNIRLIILSIYFICCKLISIVYHQSNTSKTNKTNKHTNKNKNKTKQKQMLDNVHFPVNINQWYNKGPPTNILLNCSNNIFCSIMTQC